MRIDTLPSEFEQQLNAELAQLNYHFARNADVSRLRIGAAKAIHFPHAAGGNIAGGSSGWVARKHAGGAIHEPATVATLLCLARRFQDEPVTFFDVGALYGYFALVAKALFPRATVHAFEMNAVSFKAMKQNFRANRHLGEPFPSASNVGLTDRTEGAHRSKITRFVLDENAASDDGVPLDLIRLDDFCASTGLKPDIIKMDVEGYQAKIMPGAMETIAASKPVIVLEFDNPDMLARFSKRNADVVRPLLDLGYRLFWCRFQRGRRARFEHVPAAELSEEHERNSLGLFVMP